MKKVKILLSSVAVVAVVAVAVASQARVSLKVYSLDPADGKCSVFVQDHATIVPNPNVTTRFTTNPLQPCIKATIQTLGQQD